ncbi:hypothetical protein [Myxococcus sp. RHSTA-1-4]|uniref:hypothetical protein n=1 Tax=Myxococcus sp. RHSTA-1-4 TaxID=2874601 RepID=UPI001CBF82E4|nr:hypothetical protein [Myxococcus sp. RHSTA-1-4]MBZ4418096.1 hypothetical protein [Myxococcus sp. RHSTA-1-4]
MTSSPLARTAAVVCLLWSYTARAESWGGAEPGVTTLQQVLLAFGPPSRQVHEQSEFVLTYQRKQAPDGTRGARFHFDAADGRLRRIEVTPTRPMRRAGIEALHGPECAPASTGSGDCHEVAKGPARRTWLHYRSRGLSVLLDSTQRVQRVVYVKPEVPPDTRATPRVDEEPRPAPTGDADVTPAAVPPSSDASGLATALVVDGDAPSAPAVAPQPAPVAVGDGLATPVEAPAASATGTDGSLVPGWGGPESASGDDEAWNDRKQDPLAVGGLFYQRAEVTGLRAQRKTTLQPSFPALADIYLDGRPSSRVRGFILGRLTYDPLQTEGGGPDTVLGQLWVKFDVLRHLYVTAGRQEVRWGSSQVWSPTDFLQPPNPDPLNNLDLRTGVDMVELSLPWEAMAANLSLIGTADLEGAGTDTRRLRYGGGARAEMAVGPGEVIASAVFHQSRRPRYGLDVSTGAGPLDLNAELAWVSDSSTRLWAREGDGFVERELDGGKVLASAGVSTQFEFAERYLATVRLEGFYNPLGYDDRAFLPWLSTQGDFRPLFFGRYYAMGQFNVGRRGLSELSLTLTTLANVRDASYLSRLDFRAAPFDARTITVQSFIEVPYGERGSEFRFESVPADPSASPSGLGVFRAGLSLLMRI